MINRMVASALLVILSPLLGAIASAVRLTAGSPVLFSQERSGLGAVPFRIWKFRTMRAPVDDAEDDAARITHLGALLRKTSLDELPTLWNVAKGDMAFVGPRPFIADYAALYDQREHRRLEVKPGITGWQQVNGRNRLTWEEKFELDIWYVDHRNKWLDLRILLRTPRTVLSSGAVSHGDHPTMPRFEREIPSTDKSSDDR